MVFSNQLSLSSVRELVVARQVTTRNVLSLVSRKQSRSVAASTQQQMFVAANSTKCLDKKKTN